MGQVGHSDAAREVVPTGFDAEDPRERAISHGFGGVAKRDVITRDEHRVGEPAFDPLSDKRAPVQRRAGGLQTDDGEPPIACIYDGIEEVAWGRVVRGP